MFSYETMVYLWVCNFSFSAGICWLMITSYPSGRSYSLFANSCTVTIGNAVPTVFKKYFQSPLIPGGLKNKQLNKKSVKLH